MLKTFVVFSLIRTKGLKNPYHAKKRVGFSLYFRFLYICDFTSDLALSLNQHCAALVFKSHLAFVFN